MVMPRPALKNRAAPGMVCLAHVEQVVVVRAQAQRGAHAEIGAPLQVARERFARRAQMDVGVDQHRHHGLAGEAHARRAGRHADIGGRSGLHDPRALDDQGRVLDRGAAVAHDQARAFERGDPAARAGSAEPARRPRAAVAATAATFTGPRTGTPTAGGAGGPGGGGGGGGAGGGGGGEPRPKRH